MDADPAVPDASLYVDRFGNIEAALAELTKMMDAYARRFEEQRQGDLRKPLNPGWAACSGSLDKWSPAFVAAAGALSDIARGRTATVETKSGGSYTYGYADLGDLMSHVRPTLAEQEMALTQSVDNKGKTVVVWTTILHSSGQFVTFLPMEMPSGESPQAVGSGTTYARRYSALAALGLATEVDDDGAAASGKPKRTSTAKTGGEAPAQPPTLDEDGKVLLKAMRDSGHKDPKLLSTARRIATALGRPQPTTVEALAADGALVEATLDELDGKSPVAAERPLANKEETEQFLADTGTEGAERRDRPRDEDPAARVASLIRQLDGPAKNELQKWAKAQGIANILRPKPEEVQTLLLHLSEIEPF